MTSINTSTTARRNWIPCSQRWRNQMEELAHLEDDKVTKEDGLTFVPDDLRFMILSTEKTEVLLGLWKDGTEIAIKKVRRAIFNKPEFQQELKVLLKLRFNSRHLVQYVDSAQDKYFGYIAMQLCECTLAQYIQGRPAYEERKRRTKEFLKGLKDLHDDAKVIHRDIKPQNILIDNNGRARLADFGISRVLDLEQSTMETGNAGTPCWVATEVIKNSQAGMNTRFKRSTDIQVAGMVAYYILSGGKHPFGDPAHCHSNICDGKYTLEDLEDEQAKDLVKKMLNIIPEDRPRITEVLQHPFWEKDSFLPPASRKRQAASPIPAQLGGQESGGQTQEMITVSESSLRTTNSPNGAQVGGRVPGSQTQEMRTVTDSSLMDVGRPSQSVDAAAFVDRHRAELIESVTRVMPIADALFSKKLLNHEKYSEISAAATTQEKMRKIYDYVHSAGAKGKTVFYETLLEKEAFLVETLNAE